MLTALPFNKYVEQNFTNGDIHEYVVLYERRKRFL